MKELLKIFDMTITKTARMSELRKKAYLYDKHRKAVELLEARTHHLQTYPGRKG